MKFKEWNEIAELIGIVAIVASLIFVGLQMKQSQEIARADRFEQRIANVIEMRNTINEYANIWAKGNSGDELSEIDSIVYRNLLANKEDFHYFSGRAAENLGNQPGVQANKIQFARFLHDNPGAHRDWREEEDSFEEAQSLFQTADVIETMGPWLESVETVIEKLEHADKR